MTLSPLGDSAIVATLGAGLDELALPRVRALAEALGRDLPAGAIDVVPAFASVTVFYEPARIGSYAQLCAAIEARAQRADAGVVAQESRRVEIPVCYLGDYSPDLAAVAAHSGLTPDRVVELHSGADYLVHAVGFAPGFAYLGGLPEKIYTPRRAAPRTSVPAGTVGIGGAQTGVYPLATPGGWNLIGRTPVKMFDATRAEPALLRVGDRVKFRAISAEEFRRTEIVCHVLRDKPAEAPLVECNVIRYKRAGVTVRRAGMMTTVQDLGRSGHRASGVPLGGAMDRMALRVANLLVGNAESAAGLEFTLRGPELEFAAETIVAVGGGDFGGVPLWQPVTVPAGGRLAFGGARTGCRGYLAVAGGFEVEPVLGSRGTYLRAAIGGHEGRALHDGDVLSAPGLVRHVVGRWHIDERILPTYSAAPTVRVVRGAQAEEFGGRLFRHAFSVSTKSDRMGVRLSGEALARSATTELVSTTVVPGTVQVPPDGQPIILMADAQTIGGYPQIAHVIGVDLPLVAQLKPGDSVRFHEVTLAEAHELALARERRLGMLHEGLAEKLR